MMNHEAKPSHDELGAGAIPGAIAGAMSSGMHVAVPGAVPGGVEARVTAMSWLASQHAVVADAGEVVAQVAGEEAREATGAEEARAQEAAEAVEAAEPAEAVEPVEAVDAADGVVLRANGKPETLAHLERRLRRDVGRCIADYNLIEANDRIMVCVSGGKDSLAMLHLLKKLRDAAPVKFELLAVHLDQGQPGFQLDKVRRMLEASGVAWKILDEHTYPIVEQKTAPGQAPCFMCSRLRRGILYRAAPELGCNKLALGHHRDDIAETLMMNLFRTGQLKTMAPKLVSDDGRNVVIRPLAYLATRDLTAFSRMMGFEIAPCTICSGNEEQERHKVRKLLNELERGNPHLRANILRAVQNVRVAHLLDKRLHDFGTPVGEDDDAVV